VITIKTGESAKEKTASLPKSGQTGSATKTSIKNGLFKQQTVDALKRPSGDESLSK
jgi:hypothetical protein